MEGVRNAKLEVEKPYEPKFRPLTNTTPGIEPRSIEVYMHRKIK